MIRFTAGAMAVCMAFSLSAINAAVAADAPAKSASGIELQNVNAKVRPQDDFYEYVNGKWMETTQIPKDKASWGAFAKLRDEVLPQLRALIEEAAANKEATTGSEARKLGDLYASFMDEKRLETLGMSPLQPVLARVGALQSKDDIPALIGQLNRIQVNTPYHFDVHQDARDATRYVVDFAQAGLGMPDRDYYLKADDAKLSATKAKYREHIAKMLGLAGIPDAAAKADRIVALETELARVQWTKVENRDPVKTYNKMTLAQLAELTPGHDWKKQMDAAGMSGKIDSVIVSQPSYLKGFSGVLANTPLDTWKDYFTLRVIDSFAAYLSKPFVDENFAFYGTTLNGTPELEPRWKRGVGATERSMGEALGKLYVDRHFPPAYKARMEKLVGNLLAAYRQSIDGLDWMSPETKKEAQAKLAKFTPKIGYPSKWRDYGSLKVARDDLAGNIMRAREFATQYDLDKLGKPIDREEWFMTPQTINAYYNPELNEIVFPAAILRPPFFDPDADDAANYGAIGSIIGHEISHGFDDQGSQYDGDGNLRDWWTKEDHTKFDAKTKSLVEQYNRYSPIEGYHVNGALTLGENIADNSGLAIAHKAYLLSLGGKPAPVIDGLNGEQRFFMGFGQAWRAKLRDELALVLLKSDPHSPNRFRANGSVVNQDAFYEVFGVKPGDKLYLPPNQRVRIW
ncbi:M13 family metallopeptidase [Noviherbaspirillum galbum]|uniref:M13 family peptidase n=1 Tax=Noviherbaspirillum galbum TaxID=2709383 RepID=A0A6B3SYW3_9BURK|nr:M13-type metalloendopeptidase [Noviherbaspirillum galbum]NEX64082.1 M13 family peptidase [Noviherbaspirillum galbum]